MFNFLKKLFEAPFSPGLIPDPRSESRKALDFPHTEISYGASPVVWTERTPSQWIKGVVRDQDGSSSCVGQASAKALEMLLADIYSAHPTYRRRKNFSEKGMWLADAGDILKKEGTTTEKEDPSQKMNETQMNVSVFVNTPTKISKYVFVDPRDIEVIAQVVRDNKHCVLTFESNFQEWTDVPEYLGTPIKWGHCVCATDYTLYNGEKALIVDESWGVGVTQFNAQRVITESFLRARCTGAMYFIIDTTISPYKPAYEFKQDLVFGMRRNPEVIILQQALAYYGYFPTDEQYHTGNYFQMTANAVLKWQSANNVASLSELQMLGGKRFGVKSRAKMNLLLK